MMKDRLFHLKEFIDKFSSVLVDVPCSGSGVIVKKPDILINRKEENVKEFLRNQYNVLKAQEKKALKT